MLHRFALAVAGTAITLAVGCAQSGKSPSSAPGLKASCADASLALADTTIVGTFNGQPVTFKDLGPEARRAEERALRTYCDAIYTTRSVALDNHVTEALVEAEAKKAGLSADEWVRAEVEKRVPEPSDGDIQAFIDALQMAENTEKLKAADELV